MFRRRPPPWQPPSPDPSVSPHPAPGLPDWAHGFFYLAPQSRLYFGSDRRAPVTWRPGISLARHGTFTLLLPATRRPNPEFFHLKPDDWFPRRPSPEPPTDGYLSHQYESVTHDRLIELGILRHGLRVDIAHWLKRRWGGSHG